MAFDLPSPAPYTAFGDALKEVSGQYARDKEKDRDYARDRAAKLEDLASARGYEDKVRAENLANAKDLAQKQADITFDQQMREVQKLDPVKAHATLMNVATSFGIDGADKMSDAQLFSSIQSMKHATGAADALSTAIADVKAKVAATDVSVAEDTNPLRLQAKLVATIKQNEPQARAALNDYNTANAQLNELRKSDPTLAGQMLTLDDLARQKANEFLTHVETLPPKERDALLMNQGMWTAKTPAEVMTAIRDEPTKWAQNNHVVSDKDTANLSRISEAALRSSIYSGHPEVAGLIQRINHQAITLTALGFTPGVAYENQDMVQRANQVQGYFAPENVLKPAPSTGAATPPADTANPTLSPTPAAPPHASPVFNAPTPAAPANPVLSPTPAGTVPSTPSAQESPSWFAPGQPVPKAPAGVVTDSSPTAPPVLSVPSYQQPAAQQAQTSGLPASTSPFWKTLQN